MNFTEEETNGPMLPQSRIKRLLDMASNPSSCRECGRKIWWIKSKGGKNMPITDEAINHFADCPAANLFRKKT